VDEDKARDDELVQMGFKVPRWLRRKIRWFVLRRETSMSQITREHWEKLVADEPNGPPGEGGK
jgi:hypothetical protein